MCICNTCLSKFLSLLVHQWISLSLAGLSTCRRVCMIWTGDYECTIMINHVQMAATVPIVWRLQNVNKCLSSATAPGLHERAFPNPGLTCHYLSWPLLCDWPEHGGAKGGSPQRTFGQGKRYSYTTQQRPLSTMPRLRCLTSLDKLGLPDVLKIFELLDTSWHTPNLGSPGWRW